MLLVLTQAASAGLDRSNGSPHKWAPQQHRRTPGAGEVRGRPIWRRGRQQQCRRTTAASRNIRSDAACSTTLWNDIDGRSSDSASSASCSCSSRIRLWASAPRRSSWTGPSPVAGSWGDRRPCLKTRREDWRGRIQASSGGCTSLGWNTLLNCVS